MRAPAMLFAWHVLALAGLVCAQQPADHAQPSKAPALAGERRFAPGPLAGVKVERNLEYGRVGDRRLLLDVYLPDTPPAEKPDQSAPLPVVIWIHGGGWELGTKDGCPAAALVARGYAAVSISYRFSQVATYPAQIHDCKGAVRWVRAHAKEYGIDPDRIGVWGASAGGHLAALLGTSAGVTELEGDVGGNLEQSSRVQAVCDWFGPTDMMRLCRMDRPAPAAGDKPGKRPTPPVISKLLGGDLPGKADVARLANPITFVDKSDAPFLIVHGDVDTLVPVEQSELLEKALQDVKVPANLHIVKGGGHGFWNQELLDMVRGFFDEHLKCSNEKTTK